MAWQVHHVSGRSTNSLANDRPGRHRDEGLGRVVDQQDERQKADDLPAPSMAAVQALEAEA
jgi:hypothetical protein